MAGYAKDVLVDTDWVAENIDNPDIRLVEVGEVITAAAYSGREPPPDIRAWADQVVREATPKLKGGERRLQKTARR